MSTGEQIDFDVYVTYNGEPRSEKVTVFFHYSIMPGTWLEEYTDDDGHAHFSTVDNFVNITIHVRGKERGEYTVRDGDGFTINLTDEDF